MRIDMKTEDFAYIVETDKSGVKSALDSWLKCTMFTYLFC
jgi:hypothetical protein